MDVIERVVDDKFGDFFSTEFLDELHTDFILNRFARGFTIQLARGEQRRNKTIASELLGFLQDFVGDDVQRDRALLLASFGGKFVLSGDQRTNALLLKDLSLTSFSDEGSLYRAVYQQRSYQYPLANNYGQLSLVLSKTGALLQMSSRIVSPVLLSTELPGRPGISPDKLITPLLGREFTYTSIAGKPLTYKVSQRDEISVKELVIYPRADKDRLAVHLAWQVEVGRGTTWTMYIDAMTGKELEVRPNFAG